jgi:hypothetical protein
MDRGNWEVLRALGMGIGFGCMLMSLVIGFGLFALGFAAIAIGFLALEGIKE